MTSSKAALIEQLAESEYEANVNRRVLRHSWALLPDFSKERHRERVTSRYLPLIVAFVETWIERDGRFDDEAVERAERWNCEMTDA